MLLHLRYHRPKALKKTKRKQTHPIPLDIRSINFRSINHPITLQRPNKLAHPCNSENRFTPLEDGSNKGVLFPGWLNTTDRIFSRSLASNSPRNYSPSISASQATGWFSIYLYPLTGRFQTPLRSFNPFLFTLLHTIFPSINRNSLVEPSDGLAQLFELEFL